MRERIEDTTQNHALYIYIEILKKKSTIQYKSF